MGIEMNLRTTKISVLLLSFAIFFNIFFACESSSEDNNVVDLFIMSWYKKVLEPQVYDITILGTIENVIREGDTPSYYVVDIKIDEIINLHRRWKKYFAGKNIVRTRDINKRETGEKVVVLSGDGEPYADLAVKGPAWEGSGCNFGIVLHPKEHPDAHYNGQLIEELRLLAKGGKVNCRFMDAFAHFCPLCVANYFVREMCLDENR
jgi:hypothetical protein